MDPEEFRTILSRSRVGIWELIEAAIKVGLSDCGEELQRRRDKIVEALYAPPPQLCRNCDGSLYQDDGVDEPYYPQAVSNNYHNGDNVDNGNYDEYNDNSKKFDDDEKDKRNSDDDFGKSPLTPESNHRDGSGGEEEEGFDPYGGLFDEEQTKILSIKEQLEDPQLSEDDVVLLLQNLADMQITFQALKETDIGRHVNQLRKHPSNDVRGLVKQLVRKWKETVDEWVKVNQPKGTENLNADGDSPQQRIPKNQENGHHQVPDFGYSPNPQNGSSTVERNNRERESNHKCAPKSVTRRETPSRPPPQSLPKSSALPSRPVPVMDDERLNSARRRLQENYQEAENAKKQRTIQVMDIREIPKPKAKNAFFAKNKGGFQGRHGR